MTEDSDGCLEDINVYLFISHMAGDKKKKNMNII